MIRAMGHFYKITLTEKQQNKDFQNDSMVESKCKKHIKHRKDKIQDTNYKLASPMNMENPTNA